MYNTVTPKQSPVLYTSYTLRRQLSKIMNEWAKIDLEEDRRHFIAMRQDELNLIKARTDALRICYEIRNSRAIA